MAESDALRAIPSVDKILSCGELQPALAEYGHTRCTEEIRRILTELRNIVVNGEDFKIPNPTEIANQVIAELSNSNKASPIPVHNLTGTVLHTNLGRAYLPEKALAAVTRVARGASNLEFGLTSGSRGDRDDHVSSLLTELTGAESVTVVNNNAAAVLLCLNTIAESQEVCISRGELVEIGGSFRIPEVMNKSGCVLREIGATNRTHLKDYAKALSERTGLLLKVHTSNYEIRGFTNEVSYADVAALAHEKGLPFMADLGSGTLVDLEHYGLAHEPTVQEVLSAGADVVTFSGDKLLGGPQAGIIAGRKELIDRIKQNPLKRALRVDKMTMAALAEVLRLYLNPEKLKDELPTLTFLSRTQEEINDTAETLLPVFQAALKDSAEVVIVKVKSQIGSGALPLDQLPSCAIAITPIDQSDAALRALVSAFRHLRTPMIGRMQDGRLLFDLRTVTDADTIATQLRYLGE